MKSFQSQLRPLGSWTILDVPSEIAKQWKERQNKRFLVTINGSYTWHCGLMSLGNGEYFIAVSAQRIKEMKLNREAAVEVSLEPDDSQYGMQMPEELQELLAQDDEGSVRFHSLKPGKQRNIIHYLSGIRSSNLRLERSLLMLNNLKSMPRGKEDFMKLFSV